MERISKPRGAFRPRGVTSPGRERLIQMIARRNARRIREQGNWLGGGARIERRVDVLQLWFTRSGILRFIAGDRGMVAFGGLWPRRWGRGRAIEMMNRLPSFTATVQIIYRDFLGIDGVSEVVWSRKGFGGFNPLGRRVLFATEGRVRQAPQSSLEVS